MGVSEPDFIGAPAPWVACPVSHLSGSGCSRGGRTKEILYFSLQFFIYSGTCGESPSKTSPTKNKTLRGMTL
jgi:hypothetical protein